MKIISNGCILGAVMLYLIDFRLSEVFKMLSNNARVKLGCCASSITMSIVSNLPPLLFLTLRSLYGISYSLLGLLVLVNFCTQLTIDLIFSFFSHKFNIPLTLRAMPLFTVVGILTFALFPLFFPDAAFWGLVTGTMIFSVSSGLSEVLLSPVIAALPSENPDGEMSKFHSVYAWGVVLTVIISTLFLFFFGSERWYMLALLFLIFPILAFVFFSTSRLPYMQTPEKTASALGFLKNRTVWLFVIAIFLGGASECTMAQWSSGYLEAALGIPKIWGDIFGVALFSLMLGIGRSLYGKYGKRILPVLFFSAVGATVSYLAAALSPYAALGLIACALTGLFTAMMWPGCLIAATDRFSSGGVLIFALLAAGGDLGASVAPQLVGIVTDAVILNGSLSEFAIGLGLTPEQAGMKAGMLLGMLFPLAASFVFFYMLKSGKKNK